MLDAAQSFLLLEVIQDAPPGVKVNLHGLLIHIVQQVEVKIIHAALAKLLLKDLSRMVAVAGDLMTGILGGEIVAVAGICFQHSANDPLGRSAVIGIGGIEIVHAVLYGIVHHFADLCLIDTAVSLRWQAHGAKTQQGQLLILKLAQNHGQTPRPIS